LSVLELRGIVVGIAWRVLVVQPAELIRGLLGEKRNGTAPAGRASLGRGS
jgi:hypothetical protein